MSSPLNLWTIRSMTSAWPWQEKLQAVERVSPLSRRTRPEPSPSEPTGRESPLMVSASGSQVLSDG